MSLAELVLTRARQMNIDPNILMLSLLFSAIGTGLLMYGKKAGRIPHIVAGVALMTCPYFISNAIALTAICIIIALSPFFMPET